MHYLAIYGPGSSVVGNTYDGGLGAGTARQIQDLDLDLGLAMG